MPIAIRVNDIIAVIATEGGSSARKAFKDTIGTHRVFSFCTYHVTFLLLSQPEHEELFTRNSINVKKVWGEVIKVRKHGLAGSVV